MKNKNNKNQSFEELQETVERKRPGKKDKMRVSGKSVFMIEKAMRLRHSSKAKSKPR